MASWRYSTVESHSTPQLSLLDVLPLVLLLVLSLELVLVLVFVLVLVLSFVAVLSLLLVLFVGVVPSPSPPSVGGVVSGASLSSSGPVQSGSGGSV